MKLIQKLALITTFVLGINLAIPFFAMAQSAPTYSFQFGDTGTGNGQLDFPVRGAFDSSGNIYVSDSHNHRIQKFNSLGVYQSQFGSSGTGDGQFNNPRGIGIDTSGNIYVVDMFNNRVQKFNSSGVYQSQFGTNGSGDGQFSAPIGIAFDSSGNIYIADTFNHRIQKFNSSDVYQSQFGSSGTGDGQFNLPYGIAFDSSGSIYVTDSFNNRIQKFNSSGIYQSQFGSSGTGDGQFDIPVEIAFDSSGNIYIVDAHNHRIQEFNSSGIYQSQFGSLGSGDGQFNNPLGITINEDTENIYIMDTLNDRVQVFMPYTPPGTSTVGLSLNRGDFSIDVTPTGFNFPAINIVSPNVAYKSYYNGFTSSNPISMHDGRYSGGIRISVQASDYDPGTPGNAGDDIPVSNLAVLTSNNTFDEVIKDGTPPMEAPLDGTPGNDADYTNFTNASTPIIILDGANLATPDCNIGRVGTYTTYPSFRLTIPNDAAAGTYSSTLTYDLMEAPMGC